MAIATEYSRLVFKRSTIPGITPTIPTATTIDNTWLSTDLLVGEMFMNVADDRVWLRTDNGIIEVAVSGNTMYRYTTGATLVGDIVYFDRTDQASAYTLDLSTLVVTGGTGNYLPLTGGTITGNLTVQNTNAFNVDVNGLEIISVGTGLTSSANVDTYGTIISSRDSRINPGVVNSAVIAATGRTVSANNTLYTENFDANGTVRLRNIGSASPIINLGVDLNGNIVSGISYTYITEDTGLGDVTIDAPTSVYVAADTANSAAGVSLSQDFASFGLAAIISASPDLNTISISDTSSVISFYANNSSNKGIELSSSNGIYLASDDIYVNSANATGTAIASLNVTTDGKIVTGTTASIFTGGTVTGSTTFNELSASSITILNSGTTVRNYTDYSSNLIKTGVTNSTIAAGSGNTINNNLRNVFVAGVNLTATTNDTAYFSNIVGAPYDFSVAISDETTAITSGTSKLTVYAPRNFVVSKVKISLSTSGSTTTTVDVNVGGASILSSPISLTANTFVASTTSVSSPSISEDNKITFDIDAAGSGATGLKCYLIGKTS